MLIKKEIWVPDDYETRTFPNLWYYERWKFGIGFIAGIVFMSLVMRLLYALATGK